MTKETFRIFGGAFRKNANAKKSQQELLILAIADLRIESDKWKRLAKAMMARELIHDNDTRVEYNAAKAALGDLLEGE